MFETQWKNALSLVFSLSMLGCVGDILVVIPPHAPDSNSPLRSVPPTRVGVSTHLAAGLYASGDREAAFGTPMGNVSFVPDAAASARQVLEAAQRE